MKPDAAYASILFLPGPAAASALSNPVGHGKPWRIGTEVHGDRYILPRDAISHKLSVANAQRIFFIRHAARAGFTIEEVFNLTKIDRWFLVQIKEIVDFEEDLAGAKG